MDSRNGSVIAGGFSEAQASALTGVSLRQLRLWARSDFFSPAIDPRTNRAFPATLYDFRDLVCLKVIGQLRNIHRISMKELRRVRDRLCASGPHLWATTTLYILGRKVVFENPETGRREEVSSGQRVLEIPLRLVSGDLEQAARAMRARDPATIGMIERKRGIQNARPVISGTRILVDTIRSYTEDGYSPHEIIEQFPSLHPKDIDAVLHFKESA